MIITDKLTQQGDEVVSMRDGVYLYKGSEIGLGDANTYKVYRSPETVKKIDLTGVPLTLGHITDYESKFVAHGSVRDNKIIEKKNDAVKQSIEIHNKIKACPELKKAVDEGIKELSLGYEVTQIDKRDDKAVDYDFEVVDIVPHHLAVVPKGRCGSSCKFKDENAEANKKMEIKTAKEAVAAISQIVAMMSDLPDNDVNAIKKQMRAAVGEMKKSPKEMAAEKMAKIEAEKKQKAEQEAEVEKKVKDAVEKETKDILAVYDKAKSLNVLDSNFDYAGKSKSEIMKAVVDAKYKEGTFTDAEIGVAFKMMKVETDPHANFGAGGVATKFKDEDFK